MFTKTTAHLDKIKWTPEKYEAFAAEINAIGEEVRSRMGEEDVDYIKKVKQVSRLSEIFGRTLIHFSLDPLTWSAGVFSLWIHQQLETIEIGHSALHGCWDGLKGAEEFYSPNFKWDTPIEEESWKKGHNILHHQYTNIVGRDPDVNFGFLRTSHKTPWSPNHLFQIAQFFVGAPFFTWHLNLYFTGLGELLRAPKKAGYTDVLPDRTPKTVLKAGRQSLKKLVPHFLKNYLFWPSLAGPLWWKVFTGNLFADMMRNIYSCATIYAGHFGDDLAYYDKSFQAKGRGEWYKSQIEAAHDYEVPKPVSLLCGALDYQIEHHLFPKLPPNRLREIAPKIQEICKKYGIRYNKAAWGKNLSGALKRLAKMSVPLGKSPS